jgi:hypothetical protein
MFVLLNEIFQALADIKLTGEALKKKLVEELDRYGSFLSRLHNIPPTYARAFQRSHYS